MDEVQAFNNYITFCSLASTKVQNQKPTHPPPPHSTVSKNNTYTHTHTHTRGRHLLIKLFQFFFFFLKKAGHTPQQAPTYYALCARASSVWHCECVHQWFGSTKCTFGTVWTIGHQVICIWLLPYPPLNSTLLFTRIRWFK